MRKDPGEHLVSKFLEREWQGWKTKLEEAPRKQTRGNCYMGIELRHGVAKKLSMNGFSRDSTIKMYSPCLVHFKVELSRRPGGQGCAL